jgi:LmbE family N-acetylglucosaminyl deacetylase
VEIIREHEADLVLTHRPYDYHPDHRYTSMAVQDAAFMVTVPNFCPRVPALRKNPVFAFLMDSFKKPAPFQADVAVDVDDVMNAKWDMLDAMESQMYEWLPWLDGKLDEVPQGKAERRKWLETSLGDFFLQWADLERCALVARYGAERGGRVKFAELFEICEYGTQPKEDDLARMFPF